ncbi:MAG: alpha-glucoside transport system permease protein [Pseudonocardiales bacterium]|nr:alpha-glucoside transport system permease protein [Pseudonocardiales bacterium]MDT4945201.1 alpha-glucoside transport system permease protein [Pseudonocardiales bacterium]
MHWLYSLAHSQSTAGKLAFAVVMVLLFLGVIGVLLLVIDRVPRRGREKYQAFLFLLPALLLLGLGLIGPIIRTAVSSLTSAEVTKNLCVPRPGHSCLIDKGGKWNNFANFRWAFTDNDAQYALLHTLLWTLVAPVVATVIGLAYAYAIDKIRGEGFAKSLVFLPTAISFVGAAVIWGLMYQQPSQNGASGLINVILNWFGAGPINFPTVGGWQLTMWMIVVMIWIQAGFATVVLSAAIKGVPAELSEAAKIDGATQWQAFRRVVIPSIRPTLIVVLVTISIATLKIFDLVQTFGADKYGGDTLANLMFTTYKQAGLGIAGGKLGEHRSSALAIIIFLLVIPFVAYQVRQMVKQRTAR